MHRAASQGRPIYISPISMVELVYLVEKSRLTQAVHDRVREALRDPGSVMRLAPMDLPLVSAVQAIPRESVPDMPDRIVAATAKRLALPLISRDRKIQLADVDSIW